MPGSGGAPPVGEARMEGTTLVVPTATSMHFMAVAVSPDGARARLWADDKGTPPPWVQFRRSRTVEVIARRPDGTPVAGVAFNVRNQGNNPLCPTFRSGADGVARAEGLYGELSEVCMVPAGTEAFMGMGGNPIGTVDLRKGDGRLEATVPGLRPFLLRVTMEGKPALPPRFQASVHGVFLRDIEEDPSKGEVRGEVPLEAGARAVQATLHAPGWLPAQATVEAGDGTGPLVFDLAVESGGSLHVPVALPADKRCRLSLQVQVPERGWTPTAPGGAMMMGALGPGPDGILRVEPLKPGRYRLMESAVGLVTDPVEVRAGETATLPSFDLSKQVTVRGKVLAPEGHAMKDVRILVEGPGVEPTTPMGGFERQATRPQDDGSFQVRIPGDRPVTIRPWHPTLAPAAEDGSEEVTEPRDDLVLRLELARTARMRLSPAPKSSSPWMQGGPPRILLYRGEPSGEPVAEHVAILMEVLLVFGGYPSGTWTLWIDPGPGFAPAVVRNAVLGEGDADLGIVALSEGSRVRVRILVKEGQAVPRFGVFATREDAPRYSRGMSTSGETEAVLAGLGPGRFLVQVNPVMGAPGGKGSIREVHEVDGANDLELTLDLR